MTYNPYSMPYTGAYNPYSLQSPPPPQQQQQQWGYLTNWYPQQLNQEWAAQIRPINLGWDFPPQPTPTYSSLPTHSFPPGQPPIQQQQPQYGYTQPGGYGTPPAPASYYGNYCVSSSLDGSSSARTTQPSSAYAPPYGQPADNPQSGYWSHPSSTGQPHTQAGYYQSSYGGQQPADAASAASQLASYGQGGYAKPDPATNGELVRSFVELVKTVETKVSVGMSFGELDTCMWRLRGGSESVGEMESGLGDEERKEVSIGSKTNSDANVGVEENGNGCDEAEIDSCVNNGVEKNGKSLDESGESEVIGVPVVCTSETRALPESSKEVQVIQTAEKSYLSAPHHAELVEKRWGGTTHITVEEVKKKISGLLREYVESGDTLEACRCIRELGVSFYHHEVVKRALILGMEIQTDEPLIMKLLKEAAEEGIISSSQMAKGFARLAESLDDLALDIPSAKTLFQSLVPKAISEGWLDSSIVESFGEDQVRKELGDRVHEFCIGDFVWGKIKNHPWWPGQICDPADASEHAAKLKCKDKLLVAYFGDETFAWCYPSQLKPFEEKFVEKSKLSSSKVFVIAMQQAVDEIGRLVKLKMSCGCMGKEFLNGINRPLALNAGVKDGVVVPEGDPNCLAGLTFVISGTLDSLEREEAEDLIKCHGDRVTGSVSKKTSYLLCDEDIEGRKSSKAKELGTAFITEDGLFDKIRSSIRAKAPVQEAKKSVDSVPETSLPSKNPKKVAVKSSADSTSSSLANRVSQKQFPSDASPAKRKEQTEVENPLGGASDEINFDDKKVEQLKESAEQPDIYERLTRSLAPNIWELDDVKKGLLCQIFGGNALKLPSGARFLGDINILVSDPRTSKSQLLQYIHKLASRGIYTSGRGSSAVGLTAYVAKDPETGETVLESGALVLSDRGICCIDEFDKMSDSARSMLHEVMEEQTVSIVKAGIIVSLNARTSVLACANPSGSRYNPQLSVIDNIRLPPTLLSRFDLIYLMLDKADEQIDRRLAKHIVALHFENPQTGQHDVLDVATLTAYVGYARKHIHPQLSDEAAEELTRGYVELSYGKAIHDFIEESGIVVDSHILSALIAMYAGSGSMDLAQKLFEKTSARNFVGATAMVYGYSTVGRVEDACMIFYQIVHKGLGCWSAVISGYAESERPQEALRLFSEMEVAGLRLEPVTMLSVISACAHLGALEQAIWVHLYVDKNGFGGALSINNALIDMNGKCGSLERAGGVFDKMPRRNVISWTTMISAFAMNEDANNALNFFSQMKLASVEPNSVTFVGVLYACSHAGERMKHLKHCNNLRTSCFFLWGWDVMDQPLAS